MNHNYLILHYKLMIYNGNNSFLFFKEVDLTGISQKMVVTIGPGGRVVCRR
jgi:hypothetical protein